MYCSLLNFWIVQLRWARIKNSSVALCYITIFLWCTEIYIDGRMEIYTSRFVQSVFLWYKLLCFKWGDVKKHFSLKVLGDSVSLPIEEEWLTCSQVSQRSIRLSFSTFMNCIFFLMASILTCQTWAFGEEQKGTLKLHSGHIQAGCYGQLGM